MTHALKCWPHSMDDVKAGRKTYEIRSETDRDFAVGDVLVLERYDPNRRSYLRADGSQSLAPWEIDKVFVDVMHILHGGRFGLPTGMCVMGIQLRSPQEADRVR